MRQIAIILLAGNGVRYGQDTPKLFAEIKGKPVVYYAIKSFQKAMQIDSIILVARKQDAQNLRDLTVQWGFNKVNYIILGGETRQESAMKALTFLNGRIADSDIVYIHDGARPFVKESLINKLSDALRNENAVIPVIPCDDAIVESRDGESMTAMLDKKQLWRVQTPQAFKFKIIFSAHLASKEQNAYDDAQLVRTLGLPVKIVVGDKSMAKLTTHEDLQMLEAFAEATK